MKTYDNWDELMVDHPKCEISSNRPMETIKVYEGEAHVANITLRLYKEIMSNVS